MFGHKWFMGNGLRSDFSDMKKQLIFDQANAIFRQKVYIVAFTVGPQHHQLKSQRNRMADLRTEPSIRIPTLSPRIHKPHDAGPVIPLSYLSIGPGKRRADQLIRNIKLQPLPPWTLNLNMLPPYPIISFIRREAQMSLDLCALLRHITIR